MLCPEKSVSSDVPFMACSRCMAGLMQRAAGPGRHQGWQLTIKTEAAAGDATCLKLTQGEAASWKAVVIKYVLQKSWALNAAACEGVGETCMRGKEC